jgi:predicted ribonuclease YlaK
MMYTEAIDQAASLDAVVEQLKAIKARFKDAGLIAIIDTNVLPHYKPPEQIDWASLLGDPRARLVLPLRVIEELDQKKYASRRDDVPDRARRLLSQLWARLGRSAGGPVQLRGDITIEVPLDEGPRTRPIDADSEVLDLCEELRNVGRDVVLATGDTGMSFRAVARRSRVVRMRDEDLRNPPVASAEQTGAASATATEGA